VGVHGCGAAGGQPVSHHLRAQDQLACRACEGRLSSVRPSFSKGCVCACASAALRVWTRAHPMEIQNLERPRNAFVSEYRTKSKAGGASGPRPRLPLAPTASRMPFPQRAPPSPPPPGKLTARRARSHTHSHTQPKTQTLHEGHTRRRAMHSVQAGPGISSAGRRRHPGRSRRRQSRHRRQPARTWRPSAPSAQSP
jgi:hypothetical protein